jgi:hypothetical protein
MQLADFFARLRGMNSDHAKDQKKLAKEAFGDEHVGDQKIAYADSYKNDSR